MQDHEPPEVTKIKQLIEERKEIAEQYNSKDKDIKDSCEKFVESLVGKTLDYKGLKRTITFYDKPLTKYVMICKEETNTFIYLFPEEVINIFFT